MSSQITIGLIRVYLSLLPSLCNRLKTFSFTKNWLYRRPYNYTRSSMDSTKPFCTAVLYWSLVNRRNINISFNNWNKNNLFQLFTFGKFCFVLFLKSWNFLLGGSISDWETLTKVIISLWYYIWPWSYVPDYNYNFFSIANWRLQIKRFSEIFMLYIVLFYWYLNFFIHFFIICPRRGDDLFHKVFKYFLFLNY